MNRIFFLFLIALTAPSGAAPLLDSVGGDGVSRANELRDYLRKEKPRFQQRENQRKNLLENLDKLNADENQVRERISNITANQQELTMALDNLSVEFEKQKSLEALEKKRVLMLLKVAYQIKRNGLTRYLVLGDNVSNFAARIRILYRTLRSHSALTHEMDERSRRLKASEARLTHAKEEMRQILLELNDQENLLSQYLENKHDLLKNINHKQLYFQTALREYKHVSKQVAALFENFESLRDTEDLSKPNQGTLPLPLENGHLVKTFGRSVNEKFGTVTYQKGIEIEAAQGAPVSAVMSGTVEYDGWVKGLGNVLIIHHGGGFYSLCAHLFKSLKTKGNTVEAGETVALVGDTGNSEKPSLYFEIREKGKAVDPTTFFAPRALQNFL
jgi:septal ring factor EnvC (AmiA/AmiB activator)